MHMCKCFVFVFLFSLLARPRNVPRVLVFDFLLFSCVLLGGTGQQFFSVCVMLSFVGVGPRTIFPVMVTSDLYSLSRSTENSPNPLNR